MTDKPVSKSSPSLPFSLFLPFIAFQEDIVTESLETDSATTWIYAPSGRI